MPGRLFSLPGDISVLSRQSRLVSRQIKISYQQDCECLERSALFPIVRLHIPFQGSGSVAARKSSMENLTSTPFSIRVSGSAFINQ